MSAIGTTVYELVRTAEVDLEIEGDAWPVRIELFRDRDDETTYRAHVWLLETFRIQPTFPQDERGMPRDDVGDEDLLVEWTHNLEGDLDDFSAVNDEEALALVLSAVEDFAVQVTGNGQTEG